MKIYRGTVGPSGCSVYVEDGENAHPLSPCLTIMSLSPNGFAWGYGGSGPAQLALALLIDCLGGRTNRAGVERALRLHQRFKQERIATLKAGRNWVMSANSIKAWLEAQNEGDDDAARS